MTQPTSSQLFYGQHAFQQNQQQPRQTPSSSPNQLQRLLDAASGKIPVSAAATPAPNFQPISGPAVYAPPPSPSGRGGGGGGGGSSGNTQSFQPISGPAAYVPPPSSPIGPAASIVSPAPAGQQAPTLGANPLSVGPPSFSSGARAGLGMLAASASQNALNQKITSFNQDVAAFNIMAFANNANPLAGDSGKLAAQQAGLQATGEGLRDAQARQSVFEEKMLKPVSEYNDEVARFNTAQNSLQQMLAGEKRLAEKEHQREEKLGIFGRALETATAQETIMNSLGTGALVGVAAFETGPGAGAAAGIGFLAGEAGGIASNEAFFETSNPVIAIGAGLGAALLTGGVAAGGVNALAKSLPQETNLSDVSFDLKIAGTGATARLSGRGTTGNILGTKDFVFGSKYEISPSPALEPVATITKEGLGGNVEFLLSTIGKTPSAEVSGELPSALKGVKTQYGGTGFSEVDGSSRSSFSKGFLGSGGKGTEKLGIVGRAGERTDIFAEGPGELYQISGAGGKTIVGFNRAGGISSTLVVNEKAISTTGTFEEQAAITTVKSGTIIGEGTVKTFLPGNISGKGVLSIVQKSQPAEFGTGGITSGPTSSLNAPGIRLSIHGNTGLPEISSKPFYFSAQKGASVKESGFNPFPAGRSATGKEPALNKSSSLGATGRNAAKNASQPFTIQAVSTAKRTKTISKIYSNTAASASLVLGRVAAATREAPALSIGKTTAAIGISFGAEKQLAPAKSTAIQQTANFPVSRQFQAKANLMTAFNPLSTASTLREKTIPMLGLRETLNQQSITIGKTTTIFGRGTETANIYSSVITIPVEAEITKPAVIQREKLASLEKITSLQQEKIMALQQLKTPSARPVSPSGLPSIGVAFPPFLSRIGGGGPVSGKGGFFPGLSSGRKTPKKTGLLVPFKSDPFLSFLGYSKLRETKANISRVRQEYGKGLFGFVAPEKAGSGLGRRHKGQKKAQHAGKRARR